MRVDRKDQGERKENPNTESISNPGGRGSEGIINRLTVRMAMGVLFWGVVAFVSAVVLTSQMQDPGARALATFGVTALGAGTGILLATFVK